MGCSADWERTRFTLDPVCARALRGDVFRMFRDGYVTRGKRLVNWDTQLQTSVADDETYTERHGPAGFGLSSTPWAGCPASSSGFRRPGPKPCWATPPSESTRTTAGTRTWSQTGDGAARGRDIPVIADALLADPKLGTGCVKVTPAHDPERLRVRQAQQLADAQHPQPRRHHQRHRRQVRRPRPLQGARGRGRRHGRAGAVRGQRRPCDPAQIQRPLEIPDRAGTCRTSGS